MEITAVSNNDQTLWQTCKVVTNIAIALSIITTASLLLTTGSNYYVLSAGLFAVSAIALRAILHFRESKTDKKDTQSKASNDYRPTMHQSNPIQPTPIKIHRGEEKITTDVKVIVEDKYAVLEKTQVTVHHFDKEKFLGWLKDLPDHKKGLFKNTLKAQLSSVQLNSPITFEIFQYKPKTDFKNLLEQRLTQNITCHFEEDWFDYKDKNHTYIDFANAKTFGGGWRSNGFVQEEIMFFEFLDLAIIAYATKDHPIHPVTIDPKFSSATPTPFLIPNIRRNFKIDNKIYGRGIQQFKGNIENMVRKADSPPVSIAGIAAIDWKGIRVHNPRYTYNNLKYHLEAAYLAFVAEKNLNRNEPRVHTAPWGCGAFGNREGMMVAIQLLAARMAGVEIVFHGFAHAGFNPNYTRVEVDQIRKLVESFSTPEEALQKLLALQSEDPYTWAPKVYKNGSKSRVPQSRESI